MAEPIRVLVVDDSAFIRKVVSQMLGRSSRIQVVGTARDGLDALERVQELKPDVVTLDLMMPRLDGLGFLRRQMAEAPLPIVVCSIAHESGEAALEALDAGAVDFVQKPTALATDRVYEIGDELVAKVLGAAGVRAFAPRPAASRPVPQPAAAPLTHARRADVLVIGISTGGPQALRTLIPELPADFPIPVVMVLHMPVGYTEMYAQRLDAASALHVTEAVQGGELRAGTVLLAPAGRHLSLVRQPDGAVHCHLDMKPFDKPHRPSVDVLFRSAAEAYGSRVLGLVMTGMGDDGLEGAAFIKAQGGRIATQAEPSCVVYGMPRAVEEAGLSDRVATLEQMRDTILELM